MQSSVRSAPLSEVPRLFARLTQETPQSHFLSLLLRYIPSQGSACEVGGGSGFASIWLSQRSVRAEGVEADAIALERLRQINDILGGHARFQFGDPFQFYVVDAPRYHVVHHQGLLHRYAVPWIRALLAQQVARAEKVVFTIPSVYLPYEPGPVERLLPLEEWLRILEPFQLLDLRHCGDPRHDERDHILCVIQGQEVDEALRGLMTVPTEPYPQGISAIVHTRNEAHHIEGCLKTLSGWTDEIIVCDMESRDRTVDIARRFTSEVIEHPRLINFDRARNVSAMRARYRWVFYLDADERVPSGLGPRLREMVTAGDVDFEALSTSFRTIFMGRWLQSLYPGYKAPPLYKNGKFFYNSQLHAGTQVDGRVALFPANDPDTSILHFSCDGLDHYLEKLKARSTAEALNLDARGAQFAWQNAVSDFVRDFELYYDRLDGGRDGGHGFIWSFLEGIYGFMQHAKLYERHFRENRLQEREKQVPQNLEEILQYALQVLHHDPSGTLPPIRVLNNSQRDNSQRDNSQTEHTGDESTGHLAQGEGTADIVWSGSFYSPSGYGEESRSFLKALVEAGLPVAAHDLGSPIEIGPGDSALSARLPDLLERLVRPGFIHIVHHTPQAFFRHPQAQVRIGRTMFETDRLPVEWVQRCNELDYIWVPSEFNRQTFIQSGVDEGKLRVIPPCLDANVREHRPPSDSESTPFSPENPFVFLSVFEWTARKGWDVLLRAFLTEFREADDVVLIINAASSRNRDVDEVVAQAIGWAWEELEYDLMSDHRVQFVEERLSEKEMGELYAGAHAFVLPSRGEGWGRLYMEAMACGLPVIGTNWGGNTAFMNEGNSYLIDYDLVPIPPQVWQELPHYRGHRWAEPRLSHLQKLMKRVYERRDEAGEKGRRAREYVCSEFNSERVGALIGVELARVQQESQGTLETSALPPTAIPPTTIPMRWEGSQFVWHSFAHVNRELCLQLLKSPEIELSLVPFEPDQFSPTAEPRYHLLATHQFAALSSPAAVHVRHLFPPRFTPPAEGHLVLMQPWEYGYLPKRWIEPIQNYVSEVWCYSRFERDVFLNSGIDAEKIQLIPLGVNTSIYNPSAPPYIFTTEAGSHRLPSLVESEEDSTPKGKSPFIFLFVGGTLHRKGIDILLQAYSKAFTSYDEVCLVIKDTGTRTVYRGINGRERILQRTAQEENPSIVYLDDDLTRHQMAGLYTACDCVVQPYRGEGFCLPVLEAMACGRAVIVTEGGPTDDFVDETVGWRIPAQRRSVDAAHTGPEEFVAQPWWLEADLGALVGLLRHAYRNRGEVTRRGRAGADRASKAWTWEQTSAVVIQRLKALAMAPAPNAPTPCAAGISPLPKDAPPLIVATSGEQPTEMTVSRRQPTISLCMIVRDEERVLEACLQSIAPWVDEIIVVDTGSTDRTIELAESFGAKIFRFPWCDDFARARNESLSHAIGDWVFWMDADDTIPAECGRRLRQLAFTAADEVTGFLAQVRIPPAPGETGCVVVDHVKLFRNLPDVRFEGRIHEQILESIYRGGGRVERSDVHVVHSGYDYSEEGQQRKRERDLLLLQKDLAERPDHPFVLFNVGMTAYHLKDFDRALTALEKCLALSKPHESTVRKVYAMIAGCHLAKRNLPAARERVEAGLELFPSDPELLFRSGIIARECGDLPGAETAYLKLLTAPETGHIDSVDISIRGFKARHNLGLVYRDMGRLGKAETQWRTAVSESPDFVPSWVALGDLYWQMGRFDDMSQIIAKLTTIAPSLAQALSAKLEAKTANRGNE